MRRLSPPLANVDDLRIIVKYIDDMAQRPRKSAKKSDSSPPRSLRQLLLQRSDWFENRVLQEAPRFGYDFVTPAMHRLFVHMSSKPVSTSELARRLAVSRQAVHQTVAEACRRGITELVDDPRDARVRNVRYTDKGIQMVRSAWRVASRIEARLERRLGVRDMATLRRILSKDW
jgi:DNA-binding MarR family transcriptional regulator